MSRSETKAESRYLEAFKTLKKEAKEAYQLMGDALIVEEMEEANEVKTKSGIVIQGSSRNADGFEQNKPTFVRVLDIGAGYFDEEGKDIPLEVQPGDIILVGALSVKWLSTFGSVVSLGKGERIGITREAEIQLRFKGQHGYDEVFRILGAASEPRADS